MSLLARSSESIDWPFLYEYLKLRDPHVQQHEGLLRLIQQEGLEKTSASSGRQSSGALEVSNLADRIERLRYQLLHERESRLDDVDLQAAAVLDRIFAGLTHQNRPPRSLFTALHDPEFAAEAVARLEACVLPDQPLDKVIAAAQQATRTYFSRDSNEATTGEDAGAKDRHGWRVLLYAPLYLSSHCVNYCLYCHFRFPEAITRRHLTPQEALQQARILVKRGFRHILLVAGDFPQLDTPAYFQEVIHLLRQHLPVSLAIEIAPQSTAHYAGLVEAGIVGVTLYQETYQTDIYPQYHPRGPKSHYFWRLEGLERAAEAGVTRLGLGILLGLADPLADARALVRHALYLRQRFPNKRIAVSLPRIHAAPAGFRIPHPVSDEALIRLYCGLRVALPFAELVLSTREPPQLRDRLAQICITQMSASSSTVPGGYNESGDSAVPASDGQFPVADERPVEEVVAMLHGCRHQIAWQVAELSEQTLFTADHARHS